MIRYDPTLADLTSNFFVLCTNVKVSLYNYSQWVEPSMNIHREHNGSVVECLPRDREAAGSSLTGVTALCP